MHVVATAGHVDHGKSTLVLALTGTDPDRWAEEKARGMTIDLGFAATTLPSGREVSFVDVPGHVRFLKNMLAGVGAVDACLFVVAATECWKPQSEEHLRILDVLGVGHGVIALTKVGLVDDDTRALARLEIADQVKGTFLEGTTVVEVDAPTDNGVDELRRGLDAMLAETPLAVDRGRPRLWVDRVFAARGAGTVVTGTLTGGALSVDDELVVLPGSRRARVRALQTHARDRSSVGPGHRVAVNLAGVSHDQVARGAAVVRPGQWHDSSRVDASLTVLGSLDHDVSRRGAFHAYVGSGEHPVRLRVLGEAAIPPGSTGLVRLHLPVALPLLPGDRYVLRESGRAETIGGGEILDVDPVLPASRAVPDRSVERVLRERGWIRVDDLERRTGVAVPETVSGWAVDPGALAEEEAHVRQAVRDAGDRGVAVAALGERGRLVLARLDDIVVVGGVARLAGAGAPDLAGHPWLAALDAAPFAPPDATGVERADVRALTQAGLVVEADGVWFSAAAVAQAARVVAGLLAAEPAGVTVAQVREALGTTRKWALPLLNHLDATGVTRRRGDVRIAGPRLPSPD